MNSPSAAPALSSNYTYGVRDFDVDDLDGNRLTFGMPSKSADEAEKEAHD